MSLERCARKLAIAAASLAAAFALVEIGFRIWESLRIHRGPIWAVYDPLLGYRNNPRFGDHSPEGFRDHPLEPKEGRLRIVILGDSIAYYGDDVDDTFPAHIESRLNAAADLPAVDVVDTAVKGWTNWQEIEFLKLHVEELQPDLVGVAFALNDLHHFLHTFRIEDGAIVGDSYEFSEEAVKSVDSWLYRTLRRSHFLVWVRHRLSLIEANTMIASSEGYSWEWRPDFRTAWLDGPWERIESQTAELAALGERRGFRSFVVLFPFGDQYREDYLARDRAEVLAPQRKMAAICQRLGVPLLDLYPLLDRSADLGADGIHLTGKGRRRVAELVEDFLRDRGLLAAKTGN